MSKRYGRNQRRRARERIKFLEERCTKLEDLGKQDRRIVEETAKVLGHMFPTLKPVELEVTCEGMDKISVPRMGIREDTESAYICQSILDRLQVGVNRSELDKARRTMVAYLKYRSGHSAMVLTEEALRYMPPRKLVNMVSRELVRELYKGRIGHVG